MSTKAWSDAGRSLALVSLSLILLPISLGITIISYFIVLFNPYHSVYHRRSRIRPFFEERTVLVTGVGMAKGLTLARILYLSGHRVIGADFENGYVPCSGRFSKAISKFYRLSTPNSKSSNTAYVDSLKHIVEEEKANLWISCSGVASAIEDALAKELIEAQTSCKCVQFNVNITSVLHQKDTFMRHAEKIGLSVPKTHYAASHDDVYKELTASSESPGLQFILKPVGMDDRYRADMTLLPLSTSMATRAHVSSLPISKENPWILQQYIPGDEEYCTHALIVHGQVRAFVACPSAELLMHYRALPVNDPLSRAMLAFTEEFVSKSSEKTGWNDMTGHLSFDFMCEDKAVTGHNNDFGTNRRLFAIECNPRAHTAVVLFAQNSKVDIEKIAHTYVSALGKRKSHGDICDSGIQDRPAFPDVITPPARVLPRYWIGHDLIVYVLWQVWLYVTLQLPFSLKDCGAALTIIPNRLAFWKEGTFQLWDPLPFLVLYHVYWPGIVLLNWWNGYYWSRANISTTKMFAR